jgi:tRNA-dihydrouridine synthase 1
MATSTNSPSGTGTATPQSIPTPGDNTVAEAPRPTKLHGRAFYESLGSPKFVLAPMVDQSEFVHPTPLPLGLGIS